MAKNKKALRLLDPSSDDRFDDTYDRETSFKTESVVATPILSPEGEVVAILEALNKKGDTAKGRIH